RRPGYRERHGAAGWRPATARFRVGARPADARTLSSSRSPQRSITVRTRSLCSRSNRVHSASPTRSSIAVESQMSENTIVASTRAPTSSGDFPYACPLVNSTDSHGTSPSTHATCPGGISYASPGPMVRVVPSFVRTGEPAGNGVADMAMLARVRAGDRAHVSRPAPSGLEDEAAHVDLVERDDLDEAVRKASDLVGPAEAFALQSWHDAGVSRWCSWIPEVV